METEVSGEIVCTDCGAKLPDEWIGSAERGSCPECGSTYKTINLDITEHTALQIHDCIEGKIKDSNYNARRNPRYEFFEGNDIRKRDGKWMQKTRIIDKYNDKYVEEVIDPETNEIVHSCEESLSEHFGHGSAKFKKSDDA